MADDRRTWTLIHAERAAMADTLDTLTPEQWAEPALCAGWTVRITAGHIVGGAEQTTPHFLRGMASTGFRFNTLMDRTARSLGRLEPAEIIERIRARTTTTNHPPAPVMAMLGEIVVHSEDIRRPLGIRGTVAPDAVTACLQMYQNATFPVGGKKRIHSLRLVANDVDWTHGDGPEVVGSGLSLLVAMTGRMIGPDELSGDGAAVLRSRLAPPAPLASAS
jgi:uncharacterized protein (TIGR03083 family)